MSITDLKIVVSRTPRRVDISLSPPVAARGIPGPEAPERPVHVLDGSAPHRRPASAPDPAPRALPGRVWWITSALGLANCWTRYCSFSAVVSSSRNMKRMRYRDESWDLDCPPRQLPHARWLGNCQG
jgi:hypothetical protein